MPIEGLDSEKCAKRRYLAARRDGVEAVPLRLLRGSLTRPESAAVTGSTGTLPASDEEAIALINARRGEAMPPLSLQQVWIHYAEAANDNFMSDRFAFLGSSTLRNIGSGAAAGVAFMNSHRTGGLSHPAELPFGQTFAGRTETLREGGMARQRATVGLYMLRGVKPAGESGPSTDDLHAMIDAGTVADMSVALGEGQAICDVCGKDVYDNACPHVPGTHRKMSEEEQAGQAARGVRDGKASYTIQDAQLGEVSAVFDGAVPGAGFNKFVRLERAGSLSDLDLSEAQTAYAELAELRSPVVQALMEGVADRVASALHSLGFGPKHDSGSSEPDDTDPTGASEPQEETMANPTAEAAPAVEENLQPLPEPKEAASTEPGSALSAEGEAASPEALAARAEVEQLRARAEAAERKNDELLAVEERRSVESRLGALRLGERRLALAPVSRHAVAESVLALDASHREPVLQALEGLALVQLGELGFAEGDDGTSQTPSPERFKELLSATPLGQAVLDATKPAPTTNGKEG